MPKGKRPILFEVSDLGVPIRAAPEEAQNRREELGLEVDAYNAFYYPGTNPVIVVGSAGEDVTLATAHEVAHAYDPNLYNLGRANPILEREINAWYEVVYDKMLRDNYTSDNREVIVDALASYVTPEGRPTGENYSATTTIARRLVKDLERLVKNRIKTGRR